jgi:hypothetical protein
MGKLNQNCQKSTGWQTKEKGGQATFLLKDFRVVIRGDHAYFLTQLEFMHNIPT